MDLTTHKLAVVEDGSIDGSKKILQALKSTRPDLVVSSSPVRLGRGAALRGLWSLYPADVYCYVDADLPAGTDSVSEVVRRVASGADIAVGSRYCLGAHVRRPPVVKLASRTYNQFTRWTFNDGIWDHQCGLKAFSRQAFTYLNRIVTDGGWFWDTEMLVLGLTLGFQVEEVPLKWRENRYRKTDFRRLASEVPYFLRNLVRLRSSISEMKHNQPPPPASKSDTSTGPGSPQI